MKSVKQTLFKPQSGPVRDSILLNWNDKAIGELDLYAEAYHCAGKQLVATFGTHGAPRDFEATPIVFLYRHAFELYLKTFVAIGSQLINLRGKSSLDERKLFRDHKLSNFIPHVEETIRHVGWSWDLGIGGLRTKEDFVGLIKEFETIDPGSYSFRYPIDTTGNPSVPCDFTFGLKDFADRMDPLLETLDASISGLRECWKIEMNAEQDLRDECFQ